MSKKSNKEKFIERAKAKHGDKYDYTDLVFTRMRDKINFICPKHGKQIQIANTHLKGTGCNKCSKEAMAKSKTKSPEQFIEQCKAKHGDKYDYSKIVYKGDKQPITVTCNTCNHTWHPMAGNFVRKTGCPNCVRESEKLTLEDFIKRSRKVHGDKYDYSKVKLNGVGNKVTIICPIHGEFEQIPTSHYHNGYGCRKCGDELRGKNASLTKEEFIKRANKMHDNKYDYSKVKYVNSNVKVTIICPIHGEFEQTPASHYLTGYGCNECGYDEAFKKLTMTKEQFLARAKYKHRNKYDYSKVKLGKSNKDKVTIICPIHGEFEQRVNTHLNGSGCWKCFKEMRNPYETRVMHHLEANNIVYEIEYKISNSNTNYRYDFYLPDLNVLIEVDEKHHYDLNIVDNDAIKTELAKHYGYYLIRIPEKHFYHLEYYLATQISHLYKYKIGNKYYRNFLALCNGLNLPSHTKLEDVKQHLTFNQIV